MLSFANWECASILVEMSLTSSWMFSQHKIIHLNAFQCLTIQAISIKFMIFTEMNHLYFLLFHSLSPMENVQQNLRIEYLEHVQFQFRENM